jgi:hypothetical protein
MNIYLYSNNTYNTNNTKNFIFPRLKLQQKKKHSEISPTNKPKMIKRLFSSFDPMRRTISLNYTTIVVVFTPIILFLLSKASRRNQETLKALLFTIIQEEIKATLNNKRKSIKISILLATCLIILIINLRGLFPYIFTITAQISFTLRLALPL